MRVGMLALCAVLTMGCDPGDTAAPPPSWIVGCPGGTRDTVVGYIQGGRSGRLRFWLYDNNRSWTIAVYPEDCHAQRVAQ